MKKKNLIIIKWILACVPLLMVLLFSSELPERIPVHWDLDGTVSYGGQVNLWINASMSLVFAGLFPLLRKIDPRKKNYEKFEKYYNEFQIFMMIFFIVLTGVILSESLKPGRIDVEMAVILLVGMLFAVVGNMMPKFRNNFFIGIRTPWTLSDEGVWNRTHRLGGILWFFGGLLIIGGALFLEGKPLFVLVMTVALAISLIPITASYIWFRKKGEKNAV